MWYFIIMPRETILFTSENVVDNKLVFRPQYSLTIKEGQGKLSLLSLSMYNQTFNITAKKKATISLLYDGLMMKNTSLLFLMDTTIRMI